ncbi:hypothetical protein F4809DRAFT_612265 [Biscogniauxia mediterranea]|nr:hypothetical protein F4809DRAFT_612265 [Biscogniauxia mediterranea]
MQTKVQIECMLKVKDTLDPELVGVLDNVLLLLSTKLSLASTKLENLYTVSEAPDGSSRPKIRRLKYSGTKKNLDELIADLEEWQRRFDPCWFLIMRLGNPVIDEQIHIQRKEYSSFSLAGGLRKALNEDHSKHTSVFVKDDGVEMTDIAFATAKYGRRKGQGYIIDPFNVPPQSRIDNERENVRNLARKLKNADPTTFRLLRCKHVIVDREDSTSFKFVYVLPAHLAEPRSLRQVLLLADQKGGGPLPLSDRVQIAKDLATSVSYVHNFNFVHKSIRPENILLFSDDGRGGGASSRSSSTSSRPPETFLVGFENFRAADGPTRMAGNADWEKDLYRHPSRQGAVPGAVYKMQHDIFSLGVCLLEVGMSKSFVTYRYPHPDPDPKPSSEGPLYADAIVGPELLLLHHQQQRESSAEGRLRAEALKDRLVEYARARLPGVVGARYAAAVVACLTCLDPDSADFAGGGGAMLDVDGIVVGARFIAKIITRLSEISL